MAEQPTTEQPYTEADVERVAEAMYEDDEGSTPGGWYIPWAEVDKSRWKAYRSRARAALGALAAAGRLLPEGASMGAIRAEGYRQAVEALRDADRYKAWHRQTYERTGVDHHRWHTNARHVLAGYLEAVHVNEESTDG